MKEKQICPKCGVEVTESIDQRPAKSQRAGVFKYSQVKWEAVQVKKCACSSMCDNV